MKTLKIVRPELPNYKFIENKSVQIDGIEWSISKNECEKYYVIMQNISEAYRCNCMC